METDDLSSSCIYSSYSFLSASSKREARRPLNPAKRTRDEANSIVARSRYEQSFEPRLSFVCIRPASRYNSFFFFSPFVFLFANIERGIPILVV